MGKFSFPGMGVKDEFSVIFLFTVCNDYLNFPVWLGVLSASRDISLDPLIKAMFKTSNFICTCNCAGHH